MASKRINARIEKWRIMIKEGVYRDQELLRSRIKKGIPQAIRALAWPEIVRTKDLAKEKEHKYTYPHLINTPSKSIYEISLDIPRTFPEEEDSKVLRKSLNNVLKAISIVCPRVGYCQGMNFLALRLLQVLDDEQTFWMLNHLLHKDPSLMKNFIEPKRLQEESQVFSELMKVYVPQIQARFVSQNVVMQMFTVRWFMTLFSSVLKQEVFYRIFQIYLLEGWKIIYATGLTLLKEHEAEIMKSNFEGIVFLLNAQLFHINDIEGFIGKVCAFDIPKQQLKEIEQRVHKNGEMKDYIRSSRAESIHWKAHKSAFKFPQPQSEPFEDLTFQHKSQEVSFEPFQLLEILKK